jgi:hypothetical protein
MGLRDIWIVGKTLSLGGAVIVLLEFESIDQNLFRCHPNH